jgi:hypothetical protein
VLFESLFGGFDEGSSDWVLCGIEFMFCNAKIIDAETMLVPEVHPQFVVGLACADVVDILGEEPCAVGGLG